MKDAPTFTVKPVYGGFHPTMTEEQLARSIYYEGKPTKRERRIDTPTPQQLALAEMTRKYGNTAFTKDTIDYRLVGFRQGEKTVVGMGATWDKAMEALAAKL